MEPNQVELFNRTSSEQNMIWQLNLDDFTHSSY